MSTIYTSKHFSRHSGGSSVRGEAGPAGARGEAGPAGARGEQGAAGIGIVGAKLDSGRLIFTLSNGTTLDAGSLLDLVKSVMPTAPEAPPVRALGAVRPPPK